MIDLLRERFPPSSRPLAAAAAALGVCVLSACDGAQSTLQPNGPDARAIAELHWFLTAVATVVSLIVFGLLVYAVFHKREFRGTRPPLRLTPASERAQKQRRGEIPAESGETEPTESDDDPLDVQLYTGEPDRRAVPWILLGGVAIPAVILVGTFLYTLGVMRSLHHSGPADLTIEVIGWQWWWEVHYFDPEGRQLFETANEIHIPVGKRVRFRLKSADVIHSFWVPQLAGKLDQIPGRVTQYSLVADEPGIYRGQCAEYCEEQHAHMAFLVIAEPEEEFRRWVADQARVAVEPTTPEALRGREVFLRNACSACHAVRGTPAVGNIGPDLTHVASRLTLAAAMIPNTKGHMGGWISNPQEVKPAVRMPAVPLSAEEFHAVLHYMMSLQ